MRTVRSSPADIVVSIILVLLLGTFTIAQIQQADEIANRVKCASNLRQFGMGIMLYSNENRGEYPRTLVDMDKPAPTWGTPYEGNDQLGPREPKKASAFDPKKSDVVPAPNDVTAAMFLVLRTQDIAGDVLICPSTGMEKWDFGGGKNTAANWTNWKGNKVLADHLSYSYQNPYPTKDAVKAGFKMNNSVNSEFAIAADINPGVDALLKVPMAAGEDAIRVGNSPNHGGDGQNVLFGDGHVDWVSNPYVGIDRDNVYTFGNSGTEHDGAAGTGIVGPSVGPSDSILLPTAKDLGIVDANGKLSDVARKRRLGVTPGMKPATPQQQEAARQKLMGTYLQQQAGRKVKLQVTKDQLIGTTGPVTITFNYRIADIGEGDIVRLELTAPETPASSATAKWEPDGLRIKGGQLQGKWVKE